MDFEGNTESMCSPKGAAPPRPSSPSLSASRDSRMGFSERAFSAAGAAVLSAVLMNPLDVAKTRLQAQAAGVVYWHSRWHAGDRMASLGPNLMFSDVRCSPSCPRAVILGAEPYCPPDCFQYKGTVDVLCKITGQEGFARLWRGTNAGLALAIPTVGIYLPCYDIFRNWIEEFTEKNAPCVRPYAPMFAGSMARSLACISCSPIELARTRMQAFKEIQAGTKPPGMWKTLLGVLSSVKSPTSAQNVQGFRILWTGVGAQLARDVSFSAICWSTLEPKDPIKALRMNTRQTLAEIWRDGGFKGLFTGVGPRVCRAGPSVGIVVSLYEVVKYGLHQSRQTP